MMEMPSWLKPVRPAKESKSAASVRAPQPTTLSYDYSHRLATMTTTVVDHDHGNKVDDKGTQKSELAPNFHKIG